VAYTVGLKRRFLPFFKKYRVNDHSAREDALFLFLENGHQLAFFGLSGRQCCVYPDYQLHAQPSIISQARPMPEAPAGA